MKLTLEQCKKLKEWGFPPEGSDWHWDIDWEQEESGKLYYGGKPRYTRTQLHESGRTLDVYQEGIYAMPNLEELIEWLNSDALLVGKIEYSDTEEPLFEGWTASGDWEDAWGQGKTPLEAVYNLCSALYEKENNG